MSFFGSTKYINYIDRILNTRVSQYTTARRLHVHCNTQISGLLTNYTCISTRRSEYILDTCTRIHVYIKKRLKL